MGVEQRCVADVLRQAAATADWSRIHELYSQYVELAAGDPNSSSHRCVRDALARALYRMSLTYQDSADRLPEHALAVFAEVEGVELVNADLMREHYHGVRRDQGEPQLRPTLFETIVETSRRLRDCDRLGDALAASATSGIRCGSTCYGAFYNVRGDHGDGLASDLDLIIVVKTPGDLPAVMDHMANVPGIDLHDLARLRDRMSAFQRNHDDGRTVMSHKLAMWPTGTDDPLLAGTDIPAGYRLSVHFLTLAVLDHVLVESSIRLRRREVERLRTISDYRDLHTERLDRVRTFAGREHVAPSDVRAVDGGYLRTTAAYLFDDARCYCPGFFQSMLLPAAAASWDGLRVQPRIERFMSKLADRLGHERAKRRHAVLALSLAHLRRERFAPHVIDVQDRSADSFPGLLDR